MVLDGFMLLLNGKLGMLWYGIQWLSKRYPILNMFVILTNWPITSCVYNGKQMTSTDNTDDNNVGTNHLQENWKATYKYKPKVPIMRKGQKEHPNCKDRVGT